jgi:hypothetical protein
VLAPALEVEKWEKILGRGYAVCMNERWADETREIEGRKRVWL